MAAVTITSSQDYDRYKVVELRDKLRERGIKKIDGKYLNQLRKVELINALVLDDEEKAKARLEETTVDGDVSINNYTLVPNLSDYTKHLADVLYKTYRYNVLKNGGNLRTMAVELSKISASIFGNLKSWVNERTLEPITLNTQLAYRTMINNRVRELLDTYTDKEELLEYWSIVYEQLLACYRNLTTDRRRSSMTAKYYERKQHARKIRVKGVYDYMRDLLTEVALAYRIGAPCTQHWSKVIVALIAVTGRRPSEIGHSAVFEKVDTHTLSFSGQLKGKSVTKRDQAFEIPVLIDADIILDCMKWLDDAVIDSPKDGLIPVRVKASEFPDLDEHELSKIAHQRCSTQNGRAANRFTRLVVVVDDKGSIKMSPHDWRRIYGQVMLGKYATPEMLEPTEYLHRILGHDPDMQTTALYNADWIVEDSKEV